MKSIQILRHSALQILRQPKAVLQIFLIPNALSFAAFQLAGLAFVFSPLHMQVAINRGLMPWGLLVGVGGLSVILWLWSALAWHRYILLAEQPGPLWPRIAWPAAGRFIKTSVIVCFAAFALVFCAMFALGFVLGFAQAATKQPPGWIAWSIAIVVAVPILILAFRLAINLPNAAVQGESQASSVWQATRGKFWTLVGIFIALFALRFGLGQLFLWQGITPFSTSGYVLVALSESLQAIFALSIITTLYGHYIEERPLV